jgi:hypothetical protein
MPKNKAEEWISLLEKIENLISHLLWNRYIFRELLIITEANPSLQNNNPFVVWLWENYIFSAALGVRRLCDKDKRSISLLLLLEEMQREPEILSRERYTTLFRGSGFANDLAYINSCFDSLVGEGKEHPGRNDIENDIHKLLEVAEVIISYVNKMVAHIDKDTIKELPTVNNLDASIDRIAEITEKYHAILYAGSLDLQPVAQVPWQEVFRRPWILPERG